jgi:plasmid stabilization system protein ParE
MFPVKFLELAQSELNDIFEFYQYKKDTLGHDFIEETINTLRLIKNYPEIWPKSSRHTQRCFIKGFPYVLMYQKVNHTIVVVAIVNLYKKPIHWASKTVSEYSKGRIPILPETIYIR